MKYGIVTQRITRAALDFMDANRKIPCMKEGTVFEADYFEYGAACTFLPFHDCWIYKTHIKEITEKEFITKIDQEFLK